MRIESHKKESGLVVYDIPIDDIVSKVCREINIDTEKLYSLRRERRGGHGRCLIGDLARKLAGYKVKDIALHFSREPMTISDGISEVEHLILTDEAIRTMVKRLELSLTKGKNINYLITVT